MSGIIPVCMIPDGSGTRVVVHVVPRASKSELCGLQGEALKVRLQAPPVDGKANKALCAFIADTLRIPTRDVTLASGATGRHKTLLIPGLPPAEVAKRLGRGE